MSKYTQEEYRFPIPLDEIGIDLGLPRLPKESLDTYRRRLLLHTRNPPDPTLDSIVTTPQRRVGVFEKEVMRVSLVLDAENRPVAKDPRIEINGSFLTVWDDWNEGNNEPKLKANIALRGEKYFLKDVHTALSSLSFISVSKSFLYDDYLKSFNLKVGNTDECTSQFPLSGSRLNKFELKNIRKVMLTDTVAYSNQVTDLSLMVNDGDYYIDYDFGYLYSYLPGRGNAMLEYSEFPFIFYWQPVKVFEVNDSSIKQFTRDLLLDDNGNWKRLLLNSYGAKIANIILKEHPLQWGE